MLEQGGEKTTHTSLHNDEKIFVHLHHFDGRISTVRIYQKNANEDIGFRSANVRQSASYNGKVIASKARDDTERVLENNPDAPVLAQITEIYVLEEPAESVVEKIDIELIFDDYKFSISKEFSLTRVTYSYFEALMGI